MSAWIVEAPNGGAQPLRLYCFPYAGAHAGIYLPWQARLSQHAHVCGIELPGRGARVLEPFVETIPALVEPLANAICSSSSGPIALFGHSLGALLAYEVAHCCRRWNVNRLVQLFVSGCNAPRSSYNREAPQELSDAQLINELRKLNGTPEELLSNPEFLALFIPTLRADFRLVDRYVATHETPLDVPVTVLAGSRDPCTDVKGVEDWRRETRRCTSVHWFDGEHFFVNSHQKLVLDCVATELQKCTDARGTHRELAPP